MENKEKDITDYNDENPRDLDWFVCLFWIIILVLMFFGILYLILQSIQRLAGG